MSIIVERLARVVGVLSAVALIILFFMPWVAPRGLLEALPSVSGFDLFKIRIDSGRAVMEMMEQARAEGGFIIGQMIDPMERALASPRYQAPMTGLLAIGLVPLLALVSLVFMALRWPWEWPLAIVSIAVVTGYVGARIWISTQDLGPMIEANAGFGPGLTLGAIAGGAAILAAAVQISVRMRRRRMRKAAARSGTTRRSAG